MRLAVLAFALTLPAASSALPAAQRPAHSAVPPSLCGDVMKVRPVRPVRSPETAKARRLGELPPGDLILTVLNRVGDCIEPVTVRQGFGTLDARTGR